MNDSTSFYDQFSGHEAPQKKERRENWQANRDDTTKPYTNNMPGHVKEAMVIDQKDFSYYEFDNMIFHRNPRDDFGRRVNEKFGKLEKGFDFDIEKARYIKLYRKMMEEL